VSAFGTNLATNTQPGLALPLPTALQETTVSIKDSTGTTRLAPLFFVSPLQINYQMPSGTRTGNATITVTSGNGIVTRGSVSIVDVAPGLFTADQNGSGLAAANALYVKSSGYTSTPIWRYDTALQKNVAVPVEVTRENEEVFLELYGTGIRHRANLSDVQCQIGGVAAEVLYAGVQGGYVGLDQVNVRVPKNLAGRGEVDIVLTVAGRRANTIRVHIR
ncbi:MAG: hypothetical protein JNM09_31425, partial [Blastocatellia bacterium]|nr:hypothetical protein [Blastocatellia bacterium]